MKNIFIVGSKGIPANYGGFETFVEKLTENQKNKKIKYHVACMATENKEEEYNNARCFHVKVPSIGPAKAVYYDIYALKEVLRYVEANDIKDGIVYILACRIGPFVKKYVKKLHEHNISVYVNPDGHEWKRAKWNWVIRQYWKLSERFMVKNADILICDSQNIEKYIQERYKKYHPQTTFIPYGADILENQTTNNYSEWCQMHDIKDGEYYLIVGRFVPENNYEVMIREFMESHSKRDLVIITNYENNKFYQRLENKLHFSNDSRIKFVGTVYDAPLLSTIRCHAYGYIHGHEVGGTNPSLLEALGTTKLNLLLNVGFNEEVGEASSVYWGKEKGSLSQIIDLVDYFKQDHIDSLGQQAKDIIRDKYNWEKIVNDYENLFMK